MKVIHVYFKKRLITVENQKLVFFSTENLSLIICNVEMVKAQQFRSGEFRGTKVNSESDLHITHFPTPGFILRANQKFVLFFCENIMLLFV